MQQTSRRLRRPLALLVLTLLLSLAAAVAADATVGSDMDDTCSAISSGNTCNRRLMCQTCVETSVSSSPFFWP